MLKSDRVTRRRFLSLAGGAVGALAMQSTFARAVSAAQPLTPATQPVHIGAVLPVRAGLQKAALYDVVGEAARMGAIMAGDELGGAAERTGLQLKVLHASSPTAEAAFRAAERLTATEGVCALVGGLGEGQAAAISQVAEERHVPFLNIGAPKDTSAPVLDGRYTFHVEASAAVYLDRLADAFDSSGHGQWYFVHADTVEGEALYTRAVKTVTKRHSGATVVGHVAVPPSYPNYFNELQAIRDADPDVVMLLMGGPDQLNFLGQYDSLGLAPRVTGFPYPVTQTRDFFWSRGAIVGTARGGFRAMLWEPTLESHGAKELNERFLSKWGKPMDPSAWAAYQAVRIAFQSVRSTSSIEGSQIVDFLESPEARFDVSKGVAVSFGPRDHQLRQPTYLVKMNPDAPVHPTMGVYEKLALASLVEGVDNRR